MAKLFVPDTSLEHAVRVGDQEQTLAILRSLAPAQRQAHRASARRMLKLLNEARWSSTDESYAGWGMPPTDPQVRAACAALVVCGTARDVADSQVGGDDLVALGVEFQPDSLQGLAEAKLSVSPYSIVTVQRLIAAGLVPRPDDELYFIGLICLPRSRRFEEVFAADPGLRDVLLKVMDVEGTSECNLAAIDKYSAPVDSWSHILHKLCKEGVYSREALLDRTLSALERDWPQFRAGWFSRFHGELAPNVEMMSPHARRYLALCHSRIPPTVALALDVINQLDKAGVIEDAALLAALRPVMAASVKGQVAAALKLMDRLVKRNAALSASASDLIVIALAHESADVQGQVLQRLVRWGCDAAVRKRLAAFADGIAAVNRAALNDLIGTAASMSPHAPAQPPATPDDTRGRGAISVINANLRLLPPTDLDTLVACVAHALENDADIDAFEMACTALVQLAPFDAATRERLGPVIKRAGKVRKPMARELARLLLCLADGKRREMEPAVNFYGHASAVQRQLAARTDDWIDFTRQGQRLPPLSAPTHQQGHIAPALLVERAAAHQHVGAVSSVLEQVRALLRLAVPADPEALRAARELPDTPFARALRYALGDQVMPQSEHLALFAAAARVRHPGADDDMLAALAGDLGPDGAHSAIYTWYVRSWTSQVDTTVYHHHSLVLDRNRVATPTAPDLLAVLRHLSPDADEHARWGEYWSFGGSDEGLLRFSATFIPTCLEAHFADGARAIGNNLDWWQAQWSDKVYLERLLDPTVAMTPMPTLLLALGLGAKEPGQSALAVDALVATHAEGRIDVARLSAVLQALAATPLIMASRYAKSFKAALRLDPTVSPVIFEALCAMVSAKREKPPKDFSLLLEGLQEISLARGYELPTQTRATLAPLKLSGRARTFQKALVE